MTTALTVVNKNVPSIRKALQALAAMDRELHAAKTYAEICRVERAAEAMKVLFMNVDSVRREAEVVILVANRRIAHETAEIPKASGRPSKIPSDRKEIKPGRKATGIPEARRSRQAKLLTITEADLRALAKKIQDDGKSATLTAVVHELKNDELKDKRKAYKARAERGAPMVKLEDLIAAGKKFSVIYADPPWTFHTYSDRGKGAQPGAAL